MSVPSPSSTIAVTPSGVSATNTSPDGSRSSKSIDFNTRFFAANCFSGCSERRCRPSIDASRSSDRMRHGWRPMSSPRGRRMSSRHVAMRPRGPVSMKTSTTSWKPSPGSVPGRADRSRSLTTTRVMPCGHHRLEELERLILVGGGRQQIGPPRAVHRRDRRFDGLKKRLDREVFFVDRARGDLPRKYGAQQGGRSEEQSRASISRVPIRRIEGGHIRLRLDRQSRLA